MDEDYLINIFWQFLKVIDILKIFESIKLKIHTNFIRILIAISKVQKEVTSVKKKISMPTAERFDK